MATSWVERYTPQSWTLIARRVFPIETHEEPSEDVRAVRGCDEPWVPDNAACIFLYVLFLGLFIFSLILGILASLHILAAIEMSNQTEKIKTCVALLIPTWYFMSTPVLNLALAIPLFFLSKELL